VSPQQIFDWRRQARKALESATTTAEPSFVPVVAEPLAPAPEAMAAPVRQPSSIEVNLAGAVLRIAPGTDEALLTTVLRAVRGSAA
jgi:transposase